MGSGGRRISAKAWRRNVAEPRITAGRDPPEGSIRVCGSAEGLSLEGPGSASRALVPGLGVVTATHQPAHWSWLLLGQVVLEAVAEKAWIRYQKAVASEVRHLHQVGTSKDRPDTVRSSLEYDFKLTQPAHHHLAFIRVQLSRPFALTKKSMHKDISLLFHPSQVPQIGIKNVVPGQKMDRVSQR